MTTAIAVEDLAADLHDAMRTQTAYFDWGQPWGLASHRHRDALRVVARAILPTPKVCPNPKCDGGEVPGGSKGYILCPDCRGTG